MDANSCENKVGRLIEVRAASGYRSVEDVDRMMATLRSLSESAPPEMKFVIAADWRAVTIMSPETAARAREMLMSMNPRMIRSAILTSPEQSTANLQVVRLVREAENEGRRMFTDVRKQRDWLAEMLTPPELARLNEFLGISGT
jgi:hypothetical protein